MVYSTQLCQKQLGSFDLLIPRASDREGVYLASENEKAGMPCVVVLGLHGATDRIFVRRGLVLCPVL